MSHSETRHFTLYNTNDNCIIQTLKMRAAGIHRFLKDERTTEEKLFATSKHVATTKSVINTNMKAKTEIKVKNSSTEIISEIQKATIITDEEEQIINFELKTVDEFFTFISVLVFVFVFITAFEVATCLLVATNFSSVVLSSFKNR